MSHDQDGGWRDALFNCRFCDDKSSHIFEIQLHHKAMLAVRKGLGGHATYAKFRGLLESLMVAQKDLESEDVVSKLQAHVAALEAKKRQAIKNKLYADVKVYSKKLEVAKADLEKVNVTTGKGWFTYTPLNLVDACVCVCVCVFGFVFV